MWPSVLPITVIAAILLFFAKEVAEAVRRKLGDDRKRAALRMLLARECELNHWTLKSLRRVVSVIEDKDDSTLNRSLSISFPPSGKVLLRHGDIETGYGQGPIWPVHRKLFEDRMLNVAMIDKRLSDALQAAIESMTEVDHVRSSFIDMVLSDEPDDKLHLAPFRDYALGELDDAFVALDKLYRECTGGKLEAHRLR